MCPVIYKGKTVFFNRLKIHGEKIVKEIELIPITIRNKDDELYERSPEVESQIREALTLDRKKLIERANRKDYGSEDFFQPECLVYLIRAFRRGNEAELADGLVLSLIDRCKKRINTILRKLLTWKYVDEAYEEAIDEMIGQIYDISSDKSNYAEIKFWVWLEARVCNVRRKYFKYQEEDSKAADAGDYENLLQDTRVDFDGALEKKNGLAKALSLLTTKERQLYFMRYDWKMKVHSNDPSENTISKHFNVSAETIRAWFRQAEEKLRNGAKG